MLNVRKPAYIQDSRLTLATITNFPAQTIKIPIPRIAPYGLETLFVTVTFTMNAGYSAGVVNYGVLNLVKRIVLGNIPNSTGTPINVVDVTGAELLAFNSNEGLRLDDATTATIYAVNRPSLVAAGVYRVTYAVNCVHPFLTDGLRPRCLLPIFTYAQDPILQIDFAAAAEMSGDANPFTAVVCEVWMLQRELTDAWMQRILNTGGFITWDLLTSQLPVNANQTNTQNKFLIPTPGAYTGIQVGMLKGAATSVPGDISAVTAAGTESEWQLRAAGTLVRESFRVKYMRVLNDMSRAHLGVALANNDAAAYAQNSSAMMTIGGALSTGRAIQDPSSFYLDFASDGVTDVRELGSLFNTKQWADKNLEVVLVANVTTPANQNSQVNLTGRRFTNPDLTAFTLLTGQ